jgi:hypothetical protein
VPVAIFFPVYPGWVKEGRETKIKALGANNVALWLGESQYTANS